MLFCDGFTIIFASDNSRRGGNAPVGVQCINAIIWHCAAIPGSARYLPRKTLSVGHRTFVYSIHSNDVRPLLTELQRLAVTRKQRRARIFQLPFRVLRRRPGCIADPHDISTMDKKLPSLRGLPPPRPPSCAPKQPRARVRQRGQGVQRQPGSVGLSTAVNSPRLPSVPQ